MYQLPTCSSRAQASIAGVGIEPPSPTTSSSELSWPERSMHQRLVDLDVLGLGQQLLERLEPPHQLLEPLVRDRGRLGGERRGERVVEALDVLVLLVGTGMPASSMPSRRVFSSGGRRRMTSARSSRETLALADQIRSAAARFISLVVVALRAVLDRRRREHVGPDLEQELAHAFLHRHVVEHLAQLDRVLDRHRLALLDLLRQRHALAATPRSRS